MGLKLKESHFLPKVKIKSQGNTGRCTAYASTEMLEILNLIETGKYVELSPEFQYYNEKKLDGNTRNGSTPKQAMKASARYGVCEVEYHNFSRKSDKDLLKISPTLKAYENSQKYKIQSYCRVNTVEEFKHALCMDNSPVSIAIYISGSSIHKVKSGAIPFPSGKIRSGHNVLIVGYDDNKVVVRDNKKYTGCFLMQNSWGEKWGEKGYAWIPYEYIDMDNNGIPFFSEAWAVIDVNNDVKDVIVLEIGSKLYTVNGVAKGMDVEPFLKNGRTFVPLRFVAEDLGAEVEAIYNKEHYPIKVVIKK